VIVNFEEKNLPVHLVSFLGKGYADNSLDSSPSFVERNHLSASKETIQKGVVMTNPILFRLVFITLTVCVLTPMTAVDQQWRRRRANSNDGP
jgi:hypothetical protein